MLVMKPPEDRPEYEGANTFDGTMDGRIVAHS